MCGGGVRACSGGSGHAVGLGASHLLLFPRRQEQFQRNPDSYNGAVRENYTWSQDYTDLELKVPVPKHVVKGRQVTTGLLQLHCSASVFGHRSRGCTVPEPARLIFRTCPASLATLLRLTWWPVVQFHCCPVGH